MKKYFYPIIAIVLIITLGLIIYFVYQGSTSSNENRCKTIAGREHCTEDFIGLSENDAKIKALKAGFVVRIIGRAKSDITALDDKNKPKIFLTINDGIVKKAEF